METNEQLLVLVNENDEQIGLMEKMEAHRKGLLHRAFSAFIFNSKGEMLLQKRALTKYHSAGLWTNACCSHPYEHESPEAAGERRLREELGFSVPLKKIFDFIYKAPFDNNLIEYEFDHVLIGTYNGAINLNPEEVESCIYLPMDEIKIDLNLYPQKYTAWFQIAFPMLLEKL